MCDYSDPASLEPVKAAVEGKICAFTGNTGAGKSTLLNHIAPELELKTAEISRKLGRGRHTTRVSRLYKLRSWTQASFTTISVRLTFQSTW